MKTGVVPKPYLKQQQERLEPSQLAKTEFQKDKAAGKAADTLELMGHQDRNIGIKHTILEIDKWSKSELNIIDKRLLYLESKRVKKQAYYESLAGFIWQGLKELDWPLGFHWEIELTDKGVLVSFKNRFNRKYYRAFQVSGEPKFDEAACRTMVQSCEETIDRLLNDEVFRKGKGGVFLPN